MSFGPGVKVVDGKRTILVKSDIHILASAIKIAIINVKVLRWQIEIWHNDRKYEY